MMLLPQRVPAVASGPVADISNNRALCPTQRVDVYSTGANLQQQQRSWSRRIHKGASIVCPAAPSWGTSALQGEAEPCSYASCPPQRLTSRHHRRQRSIQQPSVVAYIAQADAPSTSHQQLPLDLERPATSHNPDHGNSLTLYPVSNTLESKSNGNGAAAHAAELHVPVSGNGSHPAQPQCNSNGNNSPSHHINSAHVTEAEICVSNQNSDDYEQPSEAGMIPEDAMRSLSNSNKSRSVTSQAAASAMGAAGFAYPPSERSQIRESWGTLMRWSKVFRQRKDQISPLEATRKVVVFGGGSFGTAMGTALALQKPDLEVYMLLRDPYLCRDINQLHCNTRYLKEFKLPRNVHATTNAAEAIQGAQYAVHAVPVQSSRAFLLGIKDILPSNVPIICVSKGLEVGTGLMMSEVIPSALERKQPAVFLSGPSFAREVMEHRPTGVVAACKDAKLAQTVQALFASNTMRVNTTTDVVGVEICGALKNVLAIAAGIVEGLDLGHNAMAALIAQGCSEIRWLSEKMGGKPTTMSGLSGLGDIMLTCYGNLSRNRSVGIRLGKGEKLHDILASSPQVAEGVATAGVVVSLARKYRVSLPVLTAVAQVLDNALTPSEAVSLIMGLPQIEER